MNKVVKQSFKRAKKRAEKILKDPEKISDLSAKAGQKLDANSSSKIKSVFEGLKTLIRMTGAYAKGKYTNIPWTSLILIVAAVVYFVSPIDAIPDFIPIAGFIDDAGVIAFVLSSIASDINAFREWEKNQNAGNPN